MNLVSDIFLFARIQESVDCNNNMNIALKQIPSQAALYTDGCVDKLTQLLSEHLIYIIGGVGGIFGNKHIKWPFSKV